MPDALSAISRFIHRYAPWVVAAWVLMAILVNLVMPQLEQVVATHDQPFLPSNTPSSQAIQQTAEAFGEVPTDNIGCVVLERDGPLGESDRAYYDRLVDGLRGDADHVIKVMDWWGDPVIADAALSSDRHVVTAVFGLAGMLGTAEAAESITATRDLIQQLGPPEGLHVYVTGPGATIMDEFAAIERQTLAITLTTVAALLLLLLIIYRSLITALIPLVSVGLALAVARPTVAALGNAELIEVSMFSVALSAAVILGAGTDFAIFFIGRCQENRGREVTGVEALTDAYRGVAPAIFGSSLTIATALGCLSFARISMFRSIGIPCAIGILTAMIAGLTLTPALIRIAGRTGMLKPVGQKDKPGRRWRRIGVAVVRWPAPIFIGSGAVMLALALPLIGLRVGWDEAAATPPDADSNRGYLAADSHFAPNELLPNIVTVHTDHDLRTPAGLVAIEQISRAILAIPSVRMVQSLSRPTGVVPDRLTLTSQASEVGDQLDEALRQLVPRLGMLSEVDTALDHLMTAINTMRGGLHESSTGLGEVASAAEQMQNTMSTLQGYVGKVSEYLDPLRSFTFSIPDCSANPLCSRVGQFIRDADTLVNSSQELDASVGHLTGGSAVSARALAGLPNALTAITEDLQRASAATGSLRELLASVAGPLHGLSEYLHELGIQFQGSSGAGFYAPWKALADPRMRHVLETLASADGRATILIVYGEGREWSTDGAQRAREIDAAVHGATKEGTLTPTAVGLAGVGPATRDLQFLVHKDTILLVAATLAVVFTVVALMLASPIAGLVVVGTVAVSYASALGASVLIWQHLLGRELHWSVPPIALIALVAVGSDYNLLLTLRIREEYPGGSHVSVIRAFAATGQVVTTAGIVFGTTMFALATSSVLSVAQIGSTIGIGLVIDTLIVRSFVLPAALVLLGRWFWWPHRYTKPA